MKYTEAGEYTLTYKATDECGNESEATRKVVVEDGGAEGDIAIVGVGETILTDAQIDVPLTTPTKESDYTIEVDANYRVTNLEAVFHGLKITLDDEVKYDGDFTVDKFTHASGNMTLYVYGDESAVNNMGYIHISLDQNMTPTSAILAGFFFADTVEIAWNDYEIRKV